MISIPTLEDCARFTGLDTSGLPRRRPEPTLREIRIAARIMRTPAWVWLPRALVEDVIRIGEIRADDPFNIVSFYDLMDSYKYSGATGTGYWREWAQEDDRKIEWYASGEREPKRTYSFPPAPPEPLFRFGGGGMIESALDYNRPPLPPALNIEQLKLALEAQGSTALANMQKAIARDLAMLTFNSNQPLKRLSETGIAEGSGIEQAANDPLNQRVQATEEMAVPGEVFFSIPGMAMPKFQFGFAGFKAASMGIDTAGTFLGQQMQYRDWDDVEMARLERQGFGIEAVEEEEGEK